MTLYFCHHYKNAFLFEGNPIIFCSQIIVRVILIHSDFFTKWFIANNSIIFDVTKYLILCWKHPLFGFNICSKPHIVLQKRSEKANFAKKRMNSSNYECLSQTNLWIFPSSLILLAQIKSLTCFLFEKMCLTKSVYFCLFMCNCFLAGFLPFTPKFL